MQNLNFLEISQVKINDLEDILLIEKESFPVPWNKECFLREFFKKDKIFLVARLNNKTIGYICCWPILDELHIVNLAVKSNYRRIGIASELLKNVIKIAKDLNIKNIHLEVREKNIPAINLYKKFGFKAIGFRKNYYTDSKESAYLMELKL